MLEEITRQIEGHTICALGDAAAQLSAHVAVRALLAGGPAPALALALLVGPALRRL